MDIVPIILGSAVLGSLVSSIVNGIANARFKIWELERRDIEIATRFTEIKHQQMLAAQEWARHAEGQARPAELWDPLQTVIGYLDGLKEYRKTGAWAKADASHKPKAAS